jgi:hypothetical protein
MFWSEMPAFPIRLSLGFGRGQAVSTSTAAENSIPTLWPRRPPDGGLQPRATEGTRIGRALAESLRTGLPVTL